YGINAFLWTNKVGGDWKAFGAAPTHPLEGQPDPDFWVDELRHTSVLYSVNGLGQAVGGSAVGGAAYMPTHAIRVSAANEWNWDASPVEDLGVLGGGHYSAAWDINLIGTAVGYSTVAEGPVWQTQAVLWEAGTSEPTWLPSFQLFSDVD